MNLEVPGGRPTDVPVARSSEPCGLRGARDALVVMVDLCCLRAA